jgi:hypothetical protein
VTAASIPQEPGCLVLHVQRCKYPESSKVQSWKIDAGEFGSIPVIGTCGTDTPHIWRCFVWQGGRLHLGEVRSDDPGATAPGLGQLLRMLRKSPDLWPVVPPEILKFHP